MRSFDTVLGSLNWHHFYLQHGVSTEQYFRGEVDGKLIDVFYEIANVAKAHLDHSRELKKDVPKQAIPAFLPSVRIYDVLYQSVLTRF